MIERKIREIREAAERGENLEAGFELAIGGSTLAATGITAAFSEEIIKTTQHSLSGIGRLIKMAEHEGIPPAVTLIALASLSTLLIVDGVRRIMRTSRQKILS